MDNEIVIINAIYSANRSKPSKLMQISGNSLSRNFLCICENSEKLFVKIYHSKNSTFLIQQILYSNNIPVPRPIHEIWIDKNTYCAVYEYISAKPASFNTRNCCEKELAVVTSAYLRKMHNLKLDNAKKHEEDICLEIKKLVNYINDNSINFDRKPEILDYLLSNTVNTPIERVGIVHMDFHLNNILVSNNKGIFFTDFENLSYGDTWRDFVYAVLFHEPVENSFWLSFIHNYFDNNIPQQFWEVTKYYCYVQLLRMIICENQKGNLDSIDKLARSAYAGFPIDSHYPKHYTSM